MSFSLMDSDPSVLVALSISVPIIFLVILLCCVYKLSSNVDSLDYSPIRSNNRISDLPNEFLNDEESLLHLADEFDYTCLSPEEQNAYLKGEEFTKNHPPNFHHTKGKSYTEEDEIRVKEHGIDAFEFEQEKDILRARYIVEDKREIYFHNNDEPYSTATAVLNCSLPVKNRTFSNTIYFEVKVFEFANTDNASSHFSIGLVTKPYPSEFRLPGYNTFSMAYESTGNLKINKPFPTPLQQHCGDSSMFNAHVLPPLMESDIVGFGYVVQTGTIFITRNGKKLLDVMKGCYVDLYPAVGCFLCNARFQANLGQLGFVWVEANVRKYGFISTNDFEKIKGERGLASLPEYGKAATNELLEKGDELPPEYPEEELDFFGRSTQDVFRIGSSSRSKRQDGTSTPQEILDSEKIESKIEAKGGTTTITDEPQEIMDMRERMYERNTSNKSPESTSLLATSGENIQFYGSTSKVSSKSEHKLLSPDERDESPVQTPVQITVTDCNASTSQELQQPKKSTSRRNTKKKKSKKGSKKKK